MTAFRCVLISVRVYVIADKSQSVRIRNASELAESFPRVYYNPIYCRWLVTVVTTVRRLYNHTATSHACNMSDSATIPSLIVPLYQL